MHRTVLSGTTFAAACDYIPAALWQVQNMCFSDLESSGSAEYQTQPSTWASEPESPLDRKKSRRSSIKPSRAVAEQLFDAELLADEPSLKPNRIHRDKSETRSRRRASTNEPD